MLCLDRQNEIKIYRMVILHGESDQRKESFYGTGYTEYNRIYIGNLYCICLIANMKHVLTQMQYIFAVIYVTPIRLRTF